MIVAATLISPEQVLVKTSYPIVAADIATTRVFID
jgi:hypothetical protein